MKIKVMRVITQSEVVWWHLKNFLDRSVDFEIFIVGNNVTKYSKKFPNVNFIDLKIIRKTNLVLDLIALFKLIYLIFKIKPNIVHTIMPKAGLIGSIAAKINFIPIRIHTFTGVVWYNYSGYKRKLFKNIDKIIFLLNTDCLTDSKSQTDFLKKNGFIHKNKKLSHLGKGSLNGVDLKRFNNKIDVTNLKNKFKINDDDFVFMFLARKTIQKGIIDVFEALHEFKNYKNIKFFFIGPDESNGELEKIYHKYHYLRDKIIDLDIIENHENFLSITDVLLLPSRNEGFGSIVIEASAMKVPTIAYKCIGLEDSIEHDKSGMLIKSGDIKKFASSMKNLILDKIKLNSFREYGYQRVINYFSADYIYSELKSFYLNKLSKY
jgi:glycosyltransferase involved in cell wall biosynthesis